MRRSCLGQPFPVNLARLGGIDMDVAVLVVASGFANTHSLMPAMHSGNRIGMNWKSQVLMDAHVIPPDAQGIGVAGLVWRCAGFAGQAPLVTVVIQSHSRHQLTLAILVNLPATHVMAARDNSRLNSFRYPGAHNEVTDVCFISNQIASAHAEPGSVAGVQPQRISMRDLVQPFRVRTTRVNLNRQTKG